MKKKILIFIFMIFGVILVIKVHIESNVSSYNLPHNITDIIHENRDNLENNHDYNEICKMVPSNNDRCAVFKFVSQIYETINFYGEFEYLDPELYTFHVNKFHEIINLERSFFDRGSQCNQYLDVHDELVGLNRHLHDGYDPTRFIYYFFDFNGDGVPDLGINTGRVVHIITYCQEQDNFIWIYGVSWRERILGTNKIASIGSGDFTFIELCINGEILHIFDFYISGRYDENGEEMTTFFLGLPEGIYIPVNIHDELIFKEYSNRYYFEATEEQWNELVGGFFSSMNLAYSAISEVSFTYEELFGIIASLE